MFQAREAQYVLNYATPRVLVTESSQLALVEQIWPECPHLQHLVVTDAEIHGAHSFAALERDWAGRSVPTHDCAPDDVCDLYYTSGTTGRPKGVMCSHFNFESLLRYEQVIWSMGPSDHTMVALPRFHAKGLIIPCLLATYVGRPQTLLRRWDTRLVLELIERNQVTFFAGVPTMYAYLNAFEDIERYDISSLRICRVGGAPMPVEMQRVFEQRAGAAIIEGWGCTGWTGTSNPLNGERAIGSIGKRYGAGPQRTHYTGTVEASIKVQKAFKAYYGDKMNHKPVVFMRAAPGKPWLRLDGFTTEDALVNTAG